MRRVVEHSYLGAVSTGARWLERVVHLTPARLGKTQLAVPELQRGCADCIRRTDEASGLAPVCSAPISRARGG
jgi:hypothetical protein